jgi:hypothetical protein
MSAFWSTNSNHLQVANFGFGRVSGLVQGNIGAGLKYLVIARFVVRLCTLDERIIGLHALAHTPIRRQSIASHDGLAFIDSVANAAASSEKSCGTRWARGCACYRWATTTNALYAIPA